VSSTGSDWVDPQAGIPAALRLTTAVRALTRARWRQEFRRCAWTGLLCGLVASSLAVLAIRLGGLPVAPWHAAAAGTGLALLVAMLVAWRRRPDDLDVAIRADLRLNMKQRMSTAWELARRGGDPQVTERLAEQAVRARLPSRSATVFASGPGGTAALVPLAAIVLVMVTTLDLRGLVTSRPQAVDQSVVSEGIRLREYARRMEARARTAELPRSVEGSRRMQQLGAAMESGRLSRSRALDRLRELGEGLDEQRRAALGEGSETGIGALDVQELADSPLMRGGGPGELLQRLLRGELGAHEARGLLGDSDALSRSGIGRDDLDAALDELARGDREALREILQRLSSLDRAVDEAAELDAAREQVARAREGLGDAPTPGDRVASGPRPGSAGGGADAGSDDSDAELEEGDDVGAGGQPGTRPDPRRTAAREPEPGASYPADGPLLRPRGEPREGGVFVAEARVLPRANAPAVEAAALSPRFAAQVEEALSKDRYPAHRKDFIRRYFLTLSEGQAGEEQTP
jgi:hypothetical protein